MASPTDYDTIAARYVAQIDQRLWNALYERPNTLALLPDVKDKDVLDAGCGHGWYADWLARHGARVVGVERSAAMVTLAQARLGGRARVIAGDISDLRGVLSDAAFDIIVCALVPQYLEDLTATFLQRPGGIAVLSTHHPIRPERVLDPGYLCAALIEEEWKWLGATMRYHRRPLRDLTEPLAAAGFLIERITEPTPGEAGPRPVRIRPAVPPARLSVHAVAQALNFRFTLGSRGVVQKAHVVCEPTS